VADAISTDNFLPDVLTEIQSGGGLSLSAAGRLFPAHRGNGTVDPSTVFRWRQKGAKTTDGRLVKLEAVRVGGRWLTSREAVARFVQALTNAADPTSSSTPPTPRSVGQQQRAAQRAGERLKKMGA